MTQDNDDPWQRIWKQIDDANLVADRDRRGWELDAAIAELRQLLQEGQKCALYPLGYAYYCHPDHRPGKPAWEFTETFLLQAISENIEPDLARLRLAYHRYDEKRYEESLEVIAQIQMAKLHENMAIYCTELQLCNHLQIGPETEYPARLAGFANYINSLTDPAIPPILLLSVLERLAKEKKLTSCEAALQKLDQSFPLMNGHWFRDLVAQPPL